MCQWFVPLSLYSDSQRIAFNDFIFQICVMYSQVLQKSPSILEYSKAPPSHAKRFIIDSIHTLGHQVPIELQSFLLWFTNRVLIFLKSKILIYVCTSYILNALLTNLQNICHDIKVQGFQSYLMRSFETMKKMISLK